MIIEYTCKFCHHTRTFEPQPVDRGTSVPWSEIPQLDVEKWKKLLVCNRCADYERSRRDTEDDARRQAISILTIRKTVRNQELLQTMEAKVRENLITITRKYATLICQHFNIDFTWDMDFVVQIIESPERCEQVMAWYRANVNKFSHRVEV